VTYGYDNANRMTSLDNTTSSGTAIAVYAYTLDNNGNRTGINQTVPLTMNAAATNIPFSYNSQGGRLLSAGSNNFTYDNEGQLSSGYSNNYTFDYNHRLTGIGTNYQFSYDGTGNRLMAVRYGITTKYIYDLNGNLLADTDVNNNILHYYVYGAGLLEMVDSTGAYCYHFDATGNTVAMTNSSQNIANAYTNDPFGNMLDQQETDPQPFKYVGQYGVMAEANGFCYMRARYYDPQVGRFVSEDPQGFDGGDVNLYLYASGNPIMRIDPLGLYNLQNFLQDTNTYSTVAAVGTALGGFEPAAAVFGGIALGARGLEMVIYPNHPYVDAAAESLKMTVPPPYSIFTDKAIDTGADKLKERMDQNRCNK